mmetsp:Transcript_94107/g.181527  ORF Transcript_94107/g.181527 Transcript_94107/m.181527 type:complete len:319 (+) Transcript_94107:37-993(+)
MEFLAEGFSWPPLESDPVIFQELAEELLRSHADAERSDADRKNSPSAPQVTEVFSLDDADAIENSSALLVCFDVRRSSWFGLPPAVSAAHNAEMLTDEIYFVRQIARLDAACGIVALVHALLHADGLLREQDKGKNALSNVDMIRRSSCLLGQWLAGLQQNATSLQCGRTLAADASILAVYKKHAAKGQSRMPVSPWMLLGVPLILVTWEASRRFLGESVANFLPKWSLHAAMLVLLLSLLAYLRSRWLTCHFVCLAVKHERVVLLDGTQSGPKDLGSCGREKGAFARSALAFVRKSLLPALAKPETCAIMALSPETP